MLNDVVGADEDSSRVGAVAVPTAEATGTTEARRGRGANWDNGRGRGGGFGIVVGRFGDKYSFTNQRIPSADVGSARVRIAGVREAGSGAAAAAERGTPVGATG
jgi:hypothetical protein